MIVGHIETEQGQCFGPSQSRNRNHLAEDDDPFSCWFLDSRIPGSQHGHDQRLIEAFRQQHHVVDPHERVQSGENRGDNTREVTGQTADQQSQRHDQSQARKS